MATRRLSIVSDQKLQMSDVRSSSFSLNCTPDDISRMSLMGTHRIRSPSAPADMW